MLQSSPSLSISPQSSPSLSMPELFSTLLAGSGGDDGFGVGGSIGLVVGRRCGLLQSNSAIKQLCPFGQSLLYVVYAVINW